MVLCKPILLLISFFVNETAVRIIRWKGSWATGRYRVGKLIDGERIQIRKHHVEKSSHWQLDDRWIAGKIKVDGQVIAGGTTRYDSRSKFTQISQPGHKHCNNGLNMVTNDLIKGDQWGPIFTKRMPFSVCKNTIWSIHSANEVDSHTPC